MSKLYGNFCGSSALGGSKVTYHMPVMFDPSQLRPVASHLSIYTLVYMNEDQAYIQYAYVAYESDFW